MRMLRLFAFVALSIVCAAPALAQVVDGGDLVVAQDSWLHGLWTYLQPVALTALTIMGPAIFAMVIGLLWKLLAAAGINVSETERKRFHDGAYNAVMAYIAKRSGVLPDLITNPVPRDVINGAVEILKSTNPDGFARIGLKNVENIVLGKVPMAQASLTAAAAPPAAVFAETIAAPAAPTIGEIERAVKSALESVQAVAVGR